jgi:TRAP-type C4-dicarboxylate transport system substrate-binding protein
MTAEVNKAWNELSEDDRAEYEKQAQESGESDDESDVELEEESD